MGLRGVMLWIAFNGKRWPTVTVAQLWGVRQTGMVNIPGDEGRKEAEKVEASRMVRSEREVERWVVLER